MESYFPVRGEEEMKLLFVIPVEMPRLEWI